MGILSPEIICPEDSLLWPTLHWACQDSFVDVYTEFLVYVVDLQEPQKSSICREPQKSSISREPQKSSISRAGNVMSAELGSVCWICGLCCFDTF